jgi:hypothetical protein
MITSEREEDLREGLLQAISDLVSLDGPPAVVRTDGAPGFKALIDDKALLDRHIRIEVGRAKNVNKNPVAERAVQEVQSEILRTTSHGGAITASTLNDAINSLNSRIRTDGLSSREIFFQRDQYTNAQIPIDDMNIIQTKHNRAVKNNLSSELSKSGGRGPRINQSITVGDLVYLISDRSKNSPRDRYLVASTEDEWCSIRKFIGNTLKANSYRVKTSEVYKVPTTTLEETQRRSTTGIVEDEISIGEEELGQARQAPLDMQDSPPPEPPPAVHPREMHQPELPPPASSPHLQGVDGSLHCAAESSAPSLPTTRASQQLATSPATVAPQPPTPPETLTRPEPAIANESSEQSPRRSTRPRRPPAWLSDYDHSQ